MISNKICLSFMPEWFCLYLYFERWCKPFQQEETPCKSKDTNLLVKGKVKKENFPTFHMCILFCEILFSTDLETEYHCNHWISYPKQKRCKERIKWFQNKVKRIRNATKKQRIQLCYMSIVFNGPPEIMALFSSAYHFYLDLLM